MVDKKKKPKKVYKNEGIHSVDERPLIPEEEEVINQSSDQKKMSFVSNQDHIEAALMIIRESFGHQKLVGSNEYETIVNAVRFDIQADVIMNFINSVEAIKNGVLHKNKI